MSYDIRSYAELRERMHEALRNEHPEWLEADGSSPMLELYDARFAELLAISKANRSRSRPEQAPLRARVKAPSLIEAMGIARRRAKWKPVKASRVGTLFTRLHATFHRDQ